MRNKLGNIFIPFVLAIFCFWACTATVLGQKQSTNRRQARHAVATRRAHVWEYKITQSLDQEAMNKLGADGWELAGIHAPNIDNVRLYFKRRKR
ncbi:MAG TPA: hypothetical protein VGC60_00460 [Pyrinomonadaceae bacterium]|jgi:hypothetical protein